MILIDTVMSVFILTGLWRILYPSITNGMAMMFGAAAGLIIMFFRVLTLSKKGMQIAAHTLFSIVWCVVILTAVSRNWILAAIIPPILIIPAAVLFIILSVCVRIIWQEKITEKAALRIRRYFIKRKSERYEEEAETKQSDEREAGGNYGYGNAAIQQTDKREMLIESFVNAMYSSCRTENEIEHRRRELNRIFHPDMAGGNEELCKRINVRHDELIKKLGM
ncbi:MAG TPA: hypothetical protein PLN48_16845 [Lachnospiraceae bacterium]|nr:hypothetical protein [Lachnospiraceae bacterium]